MPSFYRRYCNGARVTVWSELRALGVAVRDTSIFDDAYAVARETMRRAKQNVETIVARLKAIDFKFGCYPGGIRRRFFRGPIVSPPKDVQRRLQKIEQAYGLIPLSLRAWWEVVGEVDLIGDPPDLSDGFDPLVVWFAPMKQLRNEYEFQFQPGRKADALFEVPIAPDVCHKDNYSGSTPYCIGLPNSAADGLVLGEEHNVEFVDYLRICFRWGGFPGLEKANTLPRSFGTLRKGLLPI